MIRVNQFVRGRRNVGQNPEPTKRVDALEALHGLCRDASPADAVISVAAGDEIAGQFMRAPAVRVAYGGLRAVEAFDAHIVRLEYQSSACRDAGLHEILGDFGLTINGDAVAGQALQVDAKRFPGEPESEPVVDQALAQHPLADVRLHEQVHRPLLQDAGADAAGDILATLAFEDDAVDAVLVQQLRQQKSRWAGADDCYLSAGHGAPPMEFLRSVAAPQAPYCTIRMRAGTYPPRWRRRKSTGLTPLWRRKKREK